MDDSHNNQYRWNLGKMLLGVEGSPFALNDVVKSNIQERILSFEERAATLVADIEQFVPEAGNAKEAGDRLAQLLQTYDQAYSHASPAMDYFWMKERIPEAPLNEEGLAFKDDVKKRFWNALPNEELQTLLKSIPKSRLNDMTLASEELGALQSWVEDIVDKPPVNPSLTQEEADTLRKDLDEVNYSKDIIKPFKETQRSARYAYKNKNGEIEQLTEREVRALRRDVDADVAEAADNAFEEGNKRRANELVPYINQAFSYKQKKDRLEGNEQPFSQAARKLKINDSSVETVTKTIRKNYPETVHKMYQLEMDGLQSDGLSPSIPLEQALATIRTSFEKMSPVFAEEFDRVLENGGLDTVIRDGVHINGRGEAFYTGPGAETAALLASYDGTVGAVRTLAHELGHVMHYNLSTKEHSHKQARHDNVHAEMAAFFTENVVLDNMIEEARAQGNDSLEKDILLSTYHPIDMDRNVMFHEYTYETFTRQGGHISAHDIAHIHSQVWAESDGVPAGPPSYNYSPGLRDEVSDYNYPLAYREGMVLNGALMHEYQNVKNDPERMEAFGEKLVTFFSLGNTQAIEKTSEDLGIPISEEATTQKAMDRHIAVVNRLEVLHAKETGVEKANVEEAPIPNVIDTSTTSVKAGPPPAEKKLHAGHTAMDK